MPRALAPPPGGESLGEKQGVDVTGLGRAPLRSSGEQEVTMADAVSARHRVNPRGDPHGGS